MSASETLEAYLYVLEHTARMRMASPDSYINQADRKVVEAIRTVLAELETAERERAALEQERDRAELIEAQGFQFKRAEQAERERDEARAQMRQTLAEVERPFRECIAALVEALEEIRSATDGVPDQSSEIAHEIAVCALVEAKGGAK